MATSGVPVAPGRSLRDAIDWLFQDRTTGKLTVAQFPNASLGIFLVATLARRLTHVHGAPRSALDVVVVASLGWWAGDEVLRGVNPWRRLLGAGVLALVVKGLVSR